MIQRAILRSEPWRFLRVLVCLAPPLLLAAPAIAQDSQYWSIQYGSVGQLVGGQVIGGVSDLSATFYNPGALALRSDDSHYLLSTESVQWERVSTTSTRPGPDVFDTSSSTWGAAPSLIAGVLPRWLGSDTSLAWSYLTRQKLDLRLGQRLTDPFVGWEHSASEAYQDQRITEAWAGLTVSRRLSESVGLGLTWYGVYRGQRTRFELSAQALAADGHTLAISGVTDFDYSHYRTLAKAGLSWHTRDWDAGLSLTTPSLGLFGSGNAAYTVSLAGVGSDAPVLAVQTVEGLDASYRSSWAVGAGASRRLGRSRLYASAEWYAPVARFEVLAVPAGSDAAEHLTQELGSVLNAGVGFEHTLDEGVAVYGAFHTDFSASVGGPAANVAASDMDLYHASGGVSFHIRGNRFTLGALWASGRKTRPVRSPIDPALVPGSALGSDVDVRYSKITFLLGFEFGR